MDGHDTERNAEEFAAMLEGGAATEGGQWAPGPVPAAPPAPSSRVLMPERHERQGSRTAEEFARMVAPMFRV